MKTALILLRSPFNAFDGEYINKIISLFHTNGFPLDWVEMLSLSDDLGFKRSIESLKEVADNIIVIHNEKAIFNIKKVISDFCDSPLVENENAKKFLDAVSKTEGKAFPEDYAYIPIDATLIPNVSGAFQGFMFDDKELTLALLPEGIKELSVTIDKYLVPYLEEKFNLKRKHVTLKYVGDLAKLSNVIEKSKEVSDCKFSCEISNKYGDVKVDFVFENYQETGGAAVLRYVVSELKEEIYAEYDVSLSERLFDILSLKNLKLSTAESFTSGEIGARIVENPGASKIFHEGITCYSNKSKIKRLGVKSEDLAREGAVSSIVAYQMALGLLREPDCDIAIATTGIAGPKSDDSEKPVGLCFIAIGMRDGIHTYRLNFSGSRREITEKAINKAMFLAIRKLKKL